MSGDGLASFDPVASLLGDLDTITTLAQSSAPQIVRGGLVPGETRPAAILLVDIVGFTPLAQVLGAEALSQLVDRCFRIFELAVQAQGGYCDKLIGDAGLYVFPGHVSYAPPCQGALRSALEIQRRVQQVNDSLAGTGLSLAVRCGVSFGEVARQRIGGDQQQFTVMGTAVNLAQRLEGAAAPGTVCTVAEVLEETGTLFDAVPLGERELKGLGTRELFTVTGERTRPVRLRGRGQISPLVGRDELLASAQAVIEGWLAGAKPKGHLLVLRGATAVGKSRLAWELSQRLGEGHELATTTAHCTPHGGLLGFAAELCKVAGLNAENVAQRWAELCQLAGEAKGSEYAEQSLQQLPLLAYVLGSGAVDTAAIRQGDSAAFSAACKTALTHCVELAALEGRQPLLVIEDVQWLGELGEVLKHLLNVELATSLVVIATARPAATDEMLQELAGDGARLHVIEVDALSLEQGRLLLAQLLPGAQLPDALEAELHEKSLGLPYYYEEAARLLLRRGVVVPEGGTGGHAGEELAGTAARATYTVVGQLDSLPIPDDLRTLILGRLDTLPAELRELAQHASVLGRSFELDDLLALEARVGSADCGAVCAALGALQQERILHQDLDRAGNGDSGLALGDPDSRVGAMGASSATRYFFTHLLTQEAAYASLLSVNRRQLHGAAGDILAAQHVPGTAAEWDLLPQLYAHYEQAARWADACRVACDTLILRARSHRLDLCEEWREKVEKCLELASHNSALHAHGKWALGVVARIKREYQASRRLLEQALLGSQTVGTSELQVSIIIDLAQVLREMHDYALAEGLLIEARNLAEQLHMPELEELVLGSLGAIYRKQGRLRESIQVLEQAATALRSTANYNRLCALLIRLGNNYLDTNELDNAYAVFMEAQAHVCKQFDPTLEVMLISNIGYYHGLVGDIDQSLAVLQEGLKRSQMIGWREGEAHNHLNLGDIYLETHQPTKACDHLSRAAALFLDTENYRGLATAQGTLGEALIQLGQFDEANTALQQADQCFERTGDQFRRGLVQISWARYHAALGNTEQAAIAISRARALGRQTSTGSQSHLENQIAKLDLNLQAKQPI